MKKYFIIIIIIVSTMVSFASLVYAQPVALKLARVLMYQKKYDEALVHYRAYLSTNPRDTSAQIEAGDICYWTKDYDEALAFYENAAAGSKFAKEVEAKIADVKIAKGDRAGAAEALEKVISADPKNTSARAMLADILSWEGKYDNSIAKYDEILSRSPRDSKSLLGKARVLSWARRYDESIAVYDEILTINPDNLEALEAKANVLSWARRYDASVATYDRLLALHFDPKPARQKARVLGWAKRFRDSLAAYDEAFEKTKIEGIDLERKAKADFWNKRVYGALKKYYKLMDIEPDNIEGRFDLAQVEGTQGMYRQASADFENILLLEPWHFRAADGKDKAQVLWKRIAVTPFAEYFRARSEVRDTNINRFTTGALLDAPITQHLAVTAGYAFDLFSYTGAASIPRQRGNIGLRTSFGPSAWVSASYLPTFYTSDHRTSHLFYGQANVRPFDPVIISIFTRRDDLYNQRLVFVNKLRATDVGGKVQADVNRRLTLFADGRWERINDGNRAEFAGLEGLIHLLYEPKQLSIDGRIDYWNYNRNVTDYFSPQNFVAGTLTAHWRHYLNPDGMYFGARNTYYGIKYRFQCDSTNHVFNGGALEFHHDFTRRFAIQAETQGLYGTIYNDVGGSISFTGRF